jgi:hypothetical protein
MAGAPLRRHSTILIMWWSSPPTAKSREPSGEKLRQFTRRSQILGILCSSRPESASQMHTAPCFPTCPVATVLPSGCSVSATMSSSCSVKNRCLPVATSWTIATAATKYTSWSSRVKCTLSRQSLPR